MALKKGMKDELLYVEERLSKGISAGFMVNNRLKEAVFGNIVSENLVSKRLIEKLGFKFDRRMSWIKLKKVGQKA